MRVALALCFCLAICLFAENAAARPCNEIELGVHKMFEKATGKHEQCFGLDPHTMPYGITYPTGERIGNCYIYFINSTGRQVQFYSIPYDREEGSPRMYPSIKLPPQNYTWEWYGGGDDYAVGAGKQLVEIYEKLGNLKGIRQPVYKFYNITFKNNKLIADKIDEKSAIQLLKNMQPFNQPYPRR